MILKYAAPSTLAIQRRRILEKAHTAVVVTEGGDTDTAQLYVNGEMAGDPLQAAMEDCAGMFYIGRNKNVSDFMVGAIDDVVLITEALDASDIAVLMNGGITATAVEPTDKLAVCWGGVKDIH